MSYILDALRRAEAERQRGAVPGLHAPVLPAGLGAAEQARRSPGWRGRVAAGVVLLLIAGIGAGWYVGRAPMPAAAPGPGAATGPLAAAPAGLPAAALVQVAPPATPTAAPPAPAAPLPAATAAPVPTAATAAAWPAPPAVPVPRTPATEAAVPPPSLPPPTPLATPPRPAVTAAAPGPVAAPPPVAAERLPAWSELPEALRREMPSLSLGGAMHAEQAELRVAIVNGQVFHEGDTVAPGLTVRAIRPKAVVFDFRGQRFEMPL